MHGRFLKSVSCELQLPGFLGLVLFAFGLMGAAPAPGHGTYAIWYGDKYDLLKVPYIVGGQVVVQWGQVETAAGQYDFSAIKKGMQTLRELKMRTTVQINGNTKPEWLFSKVPYYPEKLSIQVKDKPGTLMYWHPVYVMAYTNMLNAFADFLAKSPDRDTVIGVRLNFDAIGTEHFPVPGEAQALSKWVVPPGVKMGLPWSEQRVLEYQKAVVDTYINRLSPHVKIFVRNNLKSEISEQYHADFQSGKLGWFHTSSEAEPRSGGTEQQYRRFYEDCRSGKTVGYAEPWASAWGDHAKVDSRSCSPPQWNYWRSLLDLHCGVSFIALYANDLGVAVNGNYRVGRHHYSEATDKLGYQQEFESAFQFTSKYAGFHASPEQSPGAWVAFRENLVALATNVPSVKARQLAFFTNDYNFLMERLPDKTTGVHNVGPDNQRQGAWARVLPAGETMRLKVQDQFATSLSKGKVLVTFLDEPGTANPAFEIVSGKARASVIRKGTGRWQTATLELPTGLSSGTAGAHIQITAGPTPLCLHMVEVVR
jgi:hypothetical protein